LTDTAILDLFFERSEQAISALDTAHGAAVRRVAYNILGSIQDAEECVNDTWLAAWNAIPPSRPDPLRTFVCKIARNLAAKRYHANTAAKRNSQYDVALDELAECLPGADTPEEALAARELAKALNRFLGALPYDDRYLFMRRFWYADSPAQIAAQTGKSVNAVSVRLHRLRGKLKKQLEKEGFLP